MPAVSPLIELAEDPVFQEYVYEPVPPLTETEAVPSLPPLQLTSVAETVPEGPAATVIYVVAESVQPLPSVPTTE